MCTNISTLHSIAHVAMFLVIVSLLSLHVQLRCMYSDLVYSCGSLQRASREQNLKCEDHCTNLLNNINNHIWLQSEVFLATTPQVALPSSSQISSERYSETVQSTGVSPNKSVSVSISESTFLSQQNAPFKTSVSLKVDDLGKTGENEKNEWASGSPTDGITHSQISHFETTISKENEHLKPNEKIKKETIAPMVDIFSVQPSSTLDLQPEKKTNVYQKFFEDNDDESYWNKDKTKPDSVSFSNIDKSSDSPSTTFTEILSVSETLKQFSSAASISNIIKRNFEKTYPDNNGDVGLIRDGFILQTEKIWEDLLDGKTENYYDGLLVGGNEYRTLQIQPEPPDVGSAMDNFDEEEDDTEHIKSLLKQANSNDILTLVKKGTSASCGSFTCHFENLCYKVADNDFIFLKGEQSVIERQLLFDKLNSEELFDLSISTVPNHNAFTFSPVFLPSQGLHRFSTVTILEGNSFIIHRFKPDNVMHVLHDDILPLYHTLNSLDLILGYEKPNVTLLYTDLFGKSDYANFYNLFSSVKPFSLRNVKINSDVICFADAYIGLSNSTLWYEYGFFKPQGPLLVNESSLFQNINRAVTYLTRHLPYVCKLCTDRNYLVLLSRKDNRLVLNEGELMMSLARSTKLKVMSLSIETHSIEEIISMVKSSKGIIGMHGSLLTFLIFLQPGSVVIELFPFAVNPSKYTPFKTLCDLPNSGIVYKSWANNDKSKSVPHPDWPIKMGGINHLSHDIQRLIIDQSEVPDHLCCEDPSWLYHIYQDTEVDIDTVTLLTNEAISEARFLQIKSKSATKLLKDFPISPGPVKDLICKKTHNKDSHDLNINYLLTWLPPWNIEFIEYTLFEYQLVISEPGTLNSINISLPHSVTSYLLQPTNQRPDLAYNVWVRVTVDKTLNGPYVFVTCKIYT